ncbi:MAG: DNA replication/repair protein RecF [Candidatus Gastranaerophilales bacterium]|nr:DNA replication/repair protein RecF [Candidatus Gastranaerophilales bacterium]
MILKTLKILNFRNYDELQIDFDKNKTIIVGSNARGKTNILEGVYYLSSLSSFRTSNDKEMIKFDKDFFRIRGEIFKNDTDISIEVWLNPPRKKILKVNDIKKTKSKEFQNIINTVKFTVDDLLLVRGTPKDRRSWLDSAICQVYGGYYDRLLKYNRIKDQKNNLLRKIKACAVSSYEDILNVFDEQLINSGSNIIYLRKKYIKEIAPRAKEFHKNISEGKEELDIFYISSIEPESVEDIAENFKQKTKERRQEEIIRAKTLVGPHRDDIGFCINSNNALSFSSQGQQRTIVLSLKLAELKIIEEKINEKPILLLDDVLAELDKERQKFLLDAIENDIQSIITTVDVNNFEPEFLEGVKVINI